MVFRQTRKPSSEGFSAMAGRDFGCEKASVCCRHVVSIAASIQGTRRENFKRERSANPFEGFRLFAIP